ncbi:MAG: DMT family transporter, partial [Desulfosalsimonas sp.]|uniref:DMT family transporter n=1 Tax=Desulfosalsimonas sp. TaxID=3073848 RepID=UPI003970F4F8
MIRSVLRRPFDKASDSGLSGGFSSVVYGAALAVLAAFLFSCLNVAIRFSDPYLTIWHMMFGRSLFGTVFLVLLARITGIGLAGRKRKTLVLLSLTGTAGILSLTLALLRIPMFQALILFYTYPVVAALISPWLTSDTNSFWNWVCIVLAFMGTALALWSGQSDALGLDIGHLAGLGASAGMGLTLTLVRRVSSENSSLTPIFYISVTGMIVSFVPLFSPNVGFRVPLPGLACLGAIGLFAVLAHIVTNRALGYIASAKVGSISMLEVAFGAVYGYVLFSEPLGWSTMAGGALIIAATMGLIQGPGR